MDEKSSEKLTHKIRNFLGCKICGIEGCDKHVFSIGKAKEIKEFTGSSPPEIFVGRWNYPNVYTGILSPEEHGETKYLSSPEIWHEQKRTIPEILSFRNKLIYGRTQSNIHQLQNKFLSILQEVAMTHKPISTEFILKKPIRQQDEQAPNAPLIAHAAEIEKIRLQENPKIRPKVEYLVNDTDAKAVSSLIELEKANIETSTIMKILSAGLLGKKKNRKLVPTRWSITAVDDTLSKEKLKRIRLYPEISNIMLFHAEYLGNHYEFLLLPEKWSFEVIEISLKNMGIWTDYENFYPRKTYADSVTGAYYANRIALTEYLERIRRQALCLVFREIRPEYTDPLGVGILRQVSREAFSINPMIFNSLQEAFDDIQSRLKQPISNYINKSILLKEFGKQKRINQYL
ncbi:hypothetical protein FJZ18_04345 [Candidatus Pacearchaeota archaeon]|nr:hypothetical protein [Candidatus Pacearchaeota archaeon]